MVCPSADLGGDMDRQFVTSDLVRLELLPKPICYGNNEERRFYETFFASVEHVDRASHSLIDDAQREAETVGLSAIDALQIAAAKQAGCDEFVTAEKTTKPLFRVAGITITTVRPPSTAQATHHVESSQDKLQCVPCFVSLCWDRSRECCRWRRSRPSR